MIFFFFFFNDTATTEIYTLSLHDALPILRLNGGLIRNMPLAGRPPRSDVLLLLTVSSTCSQLLPALVDRKSTRLNSSHGYISYAVFCLKKKKHKVNYIMIIATSVSRQVRY